MHRQYKKSPSQLIENLRSSYDQHNMHLCSKNAFICSACNLGLNLYLNQFFLSLQVMAGATKGHSEGVSTKQPDLLFMLGVKGVHLIVSVLLYMFNSPDIL